MCRSDGRLRAFPVADRAYLLQVRVVRPTRLGLGTLRADPAARCQPIPARMTERRREEDVGPSILKSARVCCADAVSRHRDRDGRSSRSSPSWQRRAKTIDSASASFFRDLAEHLISTNLCILDRSTSTVAIARSARRGSQGKKGFPTPRGTPCACHALRWEKAILQGTRNDAHPFGGRDPVAGCAA